MRKEWLIILCLFFIGCVTVPEEEGNSISFMEEGKPQLTNIRNVYNGMTVQEVESIMGNQVTVGYQQGSSLEGSFDPIRIDNPVRSETFKIREKIYTVKYYFTHIAIADGQVSNDELTPVVFEKDIVIGKGYDLVFKLKN